MSEQDQGGQASTRREAASPRRAILRIAVILAVCLVIYVAEKKGWLPATPQRSTVDQQSGQVADNSSERNSHAGDSERMPSNPSIGPADDDDSSAVAPSASEESSESAAGKVTRGAPGKGGKSTTETGSTHAVVDGGLIIRRQTIRDEDGKIVYQGDVDVSGTLARIRRGESFPHRNDGSVFQNREGRLPRKPTGYYHEYVHPTPKLRGPGPQRIILGEAQEVYYTPDHYRSFQRLSIRE